MSPIQGFGPLTPQSLIINGVGIGLDLSPSIVNCIVERTMVGASTVTVIMSDFSRSILRNNILTQNKDVLTLDGLNFVFVQLAKASDQLQLVFEGEAVWELRQHSGVVVASSTDDITGFARYLCNEAKVALIGQPTPPTTAVAIGRGTSQDPNEDSWTCLQRLAATAGWRCWETGGTIYFGDDLFFSKNPVQGTLQEFTSGIFEMDFDWDVGKPFGNITATAVAGNWSYLPGSPVRVSGMGPADKSVWLVNDIQRGLYSPLATITLQSPESPAQVLLQSLQTGNAAIGLPG